MADLPPKPVLTRTISFGNILQILAMAGVVTGAWFTLQAEVADLDEDVLREAARIDAEIVARAKVEERVRELETRAAVANERYAQLLSLMQGIRDSIVRLEKRQD